MKSSKLLSVILCLSLCQGQIVLADSALQDLIDLNPEQNLTQDDVKILQQLAKNSKTPFQTNNNEVRFTYGAGNPTLVCSLLHVCDIALEPGENVVDIKVGDSLRWIIERSASGSEQGIIEHVTVKPTDLNLQSNLRIYTDRRTYYLDLKSSAQEYMPAVAFNYPESSLKKYNQIKQSLQEYTSKNVVSAGDNLQLISKLNFNYELSGDEQIMPLRVFNDGSKTYIQMPPEVFKQSLPALVAINQKGSLFKEEQTALLNYRIVNQDYVVDSLPNNLRLILGENGNTHSVDIHLKTLD